MERQARWLSSIPWVLVISRSSPRHRKESPTAGGTEVYRRIWRPLCRMAFENPGRHLEDPAAHGALKGLQTDLFAAFPSQGVFDLRRNLSDEVGFERFLTESEECSRTRSIFRWPIRSLTAINSFDKARNR
ncbi:MAG: hypothetical protein ACYCTV_10335 [Leptospirales bacterium]